MANNNEIMIVEEKPLINPVENDYSIKFKGVEERLKRDVDFGMITKTDKNTGEVKPISERPTLYKSGAEKILLLMGVPYEMIMTDSYKNHEKGYFYYEFKAVARDSEGKIIREGVGCANTNEKSCGVASGFDVANNQIKKAKKRALVDLALSLASCSDMFVQDIEDTKNEERARNIQKETDCINSKQIQRIFAIATKNGLTVESAKDLIKSWGYSSTKEIKVADYDAICEKMEKAGK